MSVNLICPGCALIFPIEAAMNDLNHRTAYAELIKLTPFPELLMGYIRMFKPPKRALSSARISKLTTELVEMIKAARFEYKRVSYVAPQAYWQDALEQLQQSRSEGTLDLPLKGHGLLFFIMAKRINKAEARKEQRHEDKLAGRSPVGGAAHASTGSARTESKPSEAAKKRSQFPKDAVAAALKKPTVN